MTPTEDGHEPALDTRVRVYLLTEEHAHHKMTLNVYFSSVGAGDMRIWCATCGRTLRIAGRVPKANAEVMIGVG
jgi:hypothetical protein